MNLLLQRDEPGVHILQRTCIELLTNLAVRFVTPEAISAAPSIFVLEYDKRVNKKKQRRFSHWA